MDQQGPVGHGQTVVGCGYIEKPKFSAIIIGDMMFQLINPLRGIIAKFTLFKFDKINRLSIRDQPVVYDSSNLHDRL